MIYMLLERVEVSFFVSDGRGTLCYTLARHVATQTSRACRAALLAAMQNKGRRAPPRNPSALRTTSKGVCLAVTMEGAVEKRKAENGVEYAMGVGVGMDGARVALTFFKDAVGRAMSFLDAGSSCSGEIRKFCLGSRFGNGFGSKSGIASLENGCGEEPGTRSEV